MKPRRTIFDIKKIGEDLDPKQKAIMLLECIEVVHNMLTKGELEIHRGTHRLATQRGYIKKILHKKFLTAVKIDEVFDEEMDDFLGFLKNLKKEHFKLFPNLFNIIYDYYQLLLEKHSENKAKVNLIKEELDEMLRQISAKLDSIYDEVYQAGGSMPDVVAIEPDGGIEGMPIRMRIDGVLSLAEHIS